MEKQIDIYLVRHAESCSNLLDNKITDTIPDTDTGKWEKYHRIIKNTEISNYNDERITSVQQKIKAKEDKLDEIMKIENGSLFAPSNTNINEIEKEIDRTGNEKLKAYYVKNLMPKYTWLFEPPLSIFGMLQSFQLRDKLEETHIDPTFIYSSSVMRTIMTAMISLCTIDTENPYTLFICPYINELQNWAGEIIDSDNQNKGNSPQEIKFKLEKFIEWFSSHGDNVYKLFLQFKGEPNTLKKITIKFPRLDFSLLEQYEQSDPDRFRISDTSKFKDIIKKQTAEFQTPKILVFTHGKFIKELTVIKVIPKNTSVTKCSLNVDTGLIMPDTITNWYNPDVSIRSRFTRKIPISLFTLNTCNSYPDKLMGMINSGFTWWW